MLNAYQSSLCMHTLPCYQHPQKRTKCNTLQVPVTRSWRVLTICFRLHSPNVISDRNINKQKKKSLKGLHLHFCLIPIHLAMASTNGTDSERGTRTLPTILATRSVFGIIPATSSRNVAWSDDGQCLLVTRQGVTVAVSWLVSMYVWCCSDGRRHT